MEANRIQWIDTYRGLGILLVIFAHLYPNSRIEAHVYSFHMFLFYFLSGYLFKKSDIKISEYIKKKICGLIIPFLFWDAISTIIEIILNRNVKASLLRMITYNGDLCWNAPIWFLLTTFWVSIIFFVLDRYILKTSLSTIILMCLSLVISYFINTNLPLELDTIALGLFFYVCGVKAKEYNITDILNKQRLIILPLSLIFSIILSQVNIRISVHNSVYGNFPICILSGISGVLLYYFIAQYLQRFKKVIYSLNFLGKNSMFFMCSQYYVFRSIQIITNYFFDIDLWHFRNTAKALIISFFTIALLSTIMSIAKKKIPHGFLNIIGVN